MPARIWCDDIDAALCKEKVKRSHTSYVRADIAERMAEALDNVRTVIEFSVAPCHSDPTGTWLETLNRIDSALTAFRSATQDTETRHD